jgi:hypothetical protein
LHMHPSMDSTSNSAPPVAPSASPTTNAPTPSGP